MENKKLLKYLLKDLSELDEMFAEKDKNTFDELEMEFIQNRVTGAKRLVQLFFEHENEVPAEIKFEGKTPLINKIEEKIQEVIVHEKAPGIVIRESIAEVEISENDVEVKAPGVFIQEVSHEIKNEEKVQMVENSIVAPEIITVSEDEILGQPNEEVQKQATKSHPVAVQQELQLEDEELVEIHSKRLGDSFSKEKSVNDLMSDDLPNLEHKLSNRPVSSIHSAIGINDRFQYIRELFEGSADNFVKTVADLDSMNDIKEAVNYLQRNFKWKKNETSLKFVNLIKRRFPNE